MLCVCLPISRFVPVCFGLFNILNSTKDLADLLAILSTRNKWLPSHPSQSIQIDLPQSPNYHLESFCPYPNSNPAVCAIKRDGKRNYDGANTVLR